MKPTLRSICTLTITIGLLSSLPGTASAQSACSIAKGDLARNPFSRASAHHRPIGAGASYASATHASTRDWRKAQHFNINAGWPWGVHMVAAGSGDPIRSVGAGRCGNSSNLPVAVRIPSGAAINASHCNDGNIVIHDQTRNTAHHFRQYHWNGGRPVAGQYREIDPRGLGHGTRMGQRLGTSASGVSASFGILRGFEINTRGHKIQHALQMVLPRLRGCKIMLSRNIVLPATDRDRTATQSGNNTGNIPYGGLLALPPSVDLNKLGLSEPGRRLAEAIRDYGIYAVDGGGCNAGALRADQTVSSAIRTQLRNDIRKIHPHIRLVLNNNVLGSATAGGGAARAPNCAYNS